MKPYRSHAYTAGPSYVVLWCMGMQFDMPDSVKAFGVGRFLKGRVCEAKLSAAELRDFDSVVMVESEASL